MSITLNWQLESPECITTLICITGDKTILRVSYNNNIWKCEALYKNTPKSKKVSSVAVWSSDNRSDAIHGCVAEILYQQSFAPPMFTCHEFKFGELE